MQAEAPALHPSPVRAREVVDIFKALRAKIVEKIYIIVISMCRVPLLGDGRTRRHKLGENACNRSRDDAY